MYMVKNGKEYEKNTRYYYEKFETFETKILNMNKRIFIKIKA